MAPRTGATAAAGATSSGKAWTEGEKLTFLFIVLEHSGHKINWTNVPLPKDRSRIACERMYSAMRTKYKDGISAMLESTRSTSATPKATKGKKGASAPVEDDEEEEAQPTKSTKKRSAPAASNGPRKRTKVSDIKVKEEDGEELADEHA